MKKRKINKKTLISFMLIILFLRLFLFSGRKIINYLKDNKDNKDIQEIIEESIIINETSDSILTLSSCRVVLHAKLVN